MTSSELKSSASKREEFAKRVREHQGWFGLPAPFFAPAMIAWHLVWLVLWFGSHWYAWKTAKRAGYYRLLAWQRVGVYVALFLAINFDATGRQCLRTTELGAVFLYPVGEYEAHVANW